MPQTLATFTHQDKQLQGTPEAVPVLHMPTHVVWNTIRTSILRYPVAVSIVNDVSGERSKAIICLTVQRWLSHSGARFSTRLVKLD
ncbi:MAG: hypothetical protein P8144_12200 [Gammaproteobacteria bacterium]